MMEILYASRVSLENALQLLEKHVGRCVCNACSLGFFHLLVPHDSLEWGILDLFPQIYLMAEWFTVSEFLVGCKF